MYRMYFPLAVCVCMAHVYTALYLVAVFGAGHGHCMHVLYSLHTNDGHVYTIDEVPLSQPMTTV